MSSFFRTTVLSPLFSFFFFFVWQTSSSSGQLNSSFVCDLSRSASATYNRTSFGIGKKILNTVLFTGLNLLGLPIICRIVSVLIETGISDVGRIQDGKFACSTQLLFSRLFLLPLFLALFFVFCDSRKCSPPNENARKLGVGANIMAGTWLDIKRATHTRYRKRSERRRRRKIGRVEDIELRTAYSTLV